MANLISTSSFREIFGKELDERRKIEKGQKENIWRNESIANELRENGIAVNGGEYYPVEIMERTGNMNSYRSIHSQRKYSMGIMMSTIFLTAFFWWQLIVLVSSEATEKKGNRIPMEYLANDPIRIQSLENIAGTIRNYNKTGKIVVLSKEDVEGWKSRNINDTRYIARLLRNYQT